MSGTPSKIADSRYTVSLEYHGTAEPSYIARFCHEPIWEPVEPFGCSTATEAWERCHAHQLRRHIALTDAKPEKPAPLIPTHPPQQQQARDYLTAVYLDWCNNYLSAATYAEHNGLNKYQAEQLIDLARDIANSPHPDA